MGDQADREEPTTTGTTELERPAERLERPARADSVNEGVTRLADAIDAIVRETDAVERGLVDPDGTPVEQAAAIKEAAESGRLAPQSGDGTDDRLQTDEMVGEEPPTQLENAAETVDRRAAPETETGRELLDALGRADEVGEQRLTTVLRAALTELDEREALTNTLTDVASTTDSREVAHLLNQQRDVVDGDVGSGLDAVATELDGTLSDLEDRRTERRRLADNAEVVCTAAADQTGVSFGAADGTDQLLDALSNRLRDGTVAFTDRERSTARLADGVKQRARPESSLSKEFIEAIREDAMDADARTETIADALAAIDSTETIRHRLEGVSPDDVDRLAGRLTRELAGIDTPGSEQLADRVANLQQLVAQAGESDRMAVYAARQELRFYDRQLLEALEGTTDRSHSEAAVQELYENVEQRRSEMRTQYPSSYPNHDHTIPIHFMELVPALQESAEEARADGELEQAVGYLQAADRTLDWVAELYDRQTYSALLEQLRG